MAIATPAHGESVIGVSTSEDGATISYDARFFDQYSPITAQDMLRWIPGTADILPENNSGGGNDPDRGFGSDGDQIIINGRRLSGKNIDIGSALQRIQARIVERIDVIRGTASGLDVRSDGILINIIMIDSAATGSGSWQAHIGDYGEPGVQPDGLVSYSNSRGRLNYLISAEYGPYNRSSTEYLTEEFRDATTGAIIEESQSTIPQDREEIKLNASGSWTFKNSDTLNLNGQATDDTRRDDNSTIASLPESGDIISAMETQTRGIFEWEFSGDLENSIGPGQLKTRAIFTSEEGDYRNSVSQTSSIPGNVPGEALVEQNEVLTESIIRSSFRWPLTNDNSLEVGLEGAANTLDKTVRLFDRQPDGDLIEIPLSNSDSEVREDRYELFATFVWNSANNMVLESALNIEHSRIEQLGQDVDNSRAFTYYKPRLDFRWDVNNLDQVRATVERTVSQLNFSDFVVRFDAEDDRIVGGNPNLEPEKAWEYSITYEHRLNRDLGVVSARGFINDIEDQIDYTEVLPGISGPGNIGDAEIYGIELKGSYRLNDLGLSGAVIDLVYTLRESDTLDAFTGESRGVNNLARQDVELNFRHEITKWRLNYLFDIQWRDYRYEYNIDYKQRQRQDKPRIHFTLQYRPTDAPLTIYFQARVLEGGTEVRERSRYDGSIADGILLRNELRGRQFAREYIVGIRGQF